MRLLGLLERDAPLVGVACLYAVVVLLPLPQQLFQDSWLPLAGGREIVRHGLPSHDTLAVWTHGKAWVDQQWLAQLAFYGLHALGGLRLVLLGHALLLVAALVSGLALARRGGASARSVALVALVAMLVAPWALQLRAQSFAPLLVFCSPYGFSLAGYYRRLLVNPLLPSFLEEWRASAPSQRTALFFVLAFAAIWLVARHGRALTLFERGALLLTLVSALAAIRSIVWFGLACLVLLPRLLDLALPRLRLPARRAFAAPRLGATAAAAALTVSAQPAPYVFADDRTADWLLWEDPRLAGRLAYDVRYELFDDRQFRELLAFRNPSGAGWRRAAAGYGVLTLDPRTEGSLERALLAEPGARLVYRGPGLDVLVRTPEFAPGAERVE